MFVKKKKGQVVTYETKRQSLQHLNKMAMVFLWYSLEQSRINHFVIEKLRHVFDQDADRDIVPNSCLVSVYKFLRNS